MKTEGIVITKTPFRLSFFGGGTDLPFYFNQEESVILSVSINKYLYVTINSLKRLYDKKIRLSYSKLEVVDSPDDLQHGIVREALKNHPFFDKDSFIDIHSYADFPASCGMGSSSAFAVGFLNALYSLNSIYRSPSEIAREAIEIEREKLQEIGGWQDQIAAAFGGFNLINFRNNQFFVEPMVLSQEKKQALEQSCLLFFTGGVRSSTDIQQAVFKENSLDKMDHLNSIKKASLEAINILRTCVCAKELIYELGRVLNKSWEMKRNLSPLISNTHIDRMYETAINAGAIGGKLCGAGGNGFLLIIAPPEKRENIVLALNQYQYVSINFDYSGSRVIYSEIRESN